MASVLKYFFLFSFGGIVYVLIEMLWRGYSHWSMFILGGICFVLLGLINKKYTWDIPLLIQMLIGTFIITLMEFIFGCIFNLLLNRMGLLRFAVQYYGADMSAVYVFMVFTKSCLYSR